MSVNMELLPERIRADILEYCAENHRDPPTTQEEALDFFLTWNGIVGYTSTIRYAIFEIMSSSQVYLMNTDAERAAWLRKVAEIPAEVDL